MRLLVSANLLFTALICGTALAALPLPAAAQIYIRTDPAGRQVWSDHPINQPTAVYAVPVYSTYRSICPAVIA